MAQRSLILDTGAILALLSGDTQVRALLRLAHEEGGDIVVPPAVVTQVIRGGAQDAAANRLFNTVYIPFVGERLARAAGVLLGRSGLRDVADAQIVAEAVRRAPATILTGDPTDIEQLVAQTTGVRILRV